MAEVNVASRGVVRVMAERCGTCIFRPGNLMHLRPGQLRDMVQGVRQIDGCIPCHETLDLAEQAVCRGQYETVPTPTLRLAQLMGVIEEV